VHTLPLPEMSTVVNSTTQQAPSESRSSEFPIPNSEFRISNPEARTPNSSSRFPAAQRRAADPGHHLTAQQLQFLLRVAPPALASQRRYEVPACVTIAQAILESATPVGWGSSTLFRRANNPFGIKYAHFGSGDRVIGRSGEQTDPLIGRLGDGLGNEGNPSPNHLHTGSTPPLSLADHREKGNHQVTGSAHQQITASSAHPITPSPDHPIPEAYNHFDAPTWEIENGQKKAITAQFQRFSNLEEAFLAHARLLCSARYRTAFAVRDDWKQFAERLGPKASRMDMEHCGYSTNPSYSAEIVTLVGRYRLNDPRALQWFATGKDPGHRAIQPSDHRVIGEEIARSLDEPLKQSVAGNS
jgi:flagellum-specific peptidoglycan hydrolase FlgJ